MKNNSGVKLNSKIDNDNIEVTHKIGPSLVNGDIDDFMNKKDCLLHGTEEDSIKYSYELNRCMNDAELAGYKILEAQEKERNRIACDLHDSVIQNLTNLVHKTELCLKTADKDIIEVKLDLQLMMNYTRSIINDIRGIVYNLRPMALDDLGLIVAIKRYTESLQNQKGITVEFNCNDADELVCANSSIINLSLFRIIQEACSNACKHGNASFIQIILRSNENKIELVIKDNGSGFDIKTIAKRNKNDNSGFGLSIMKERVYLLSGNIEINSKISKGTVINVAIPI